jgi:ferric-dicitrate binding protein FerR (iron transport regulator)
MTHALRTQLEQVTAEAAREARELEALEAKLTELRLTVARFEANAANETAALRQTRRNARLAFLCAVLAGLGLVIGLAHFAPANGKSKPRPDPPWMYHPTKY